RPMTDQADNVEAITRQAIEHCRRDIALAWTQVEAAKDLLKRSHGLLDQWIAEKAQIDSAPKPAADERPIIHVAGRLIAAPPARPIPPGAAPSTAPPPEPDRRRRTSRSRAYRRRLRQHAQRFRKASA